ncbi:MAG: lipopolysaccharide biosynthesis protein [Veillonellaceae bacterium]|nr:lipopolysaccharide biosynthesis protein [Veillonellaceae bacterium]
MKRLSPKVLFDSSDLESRILERSVSGGVISIGAQCLQFVLQLAGTSLLARLLSPADYGTVAMAAIVVGFVSMFKDAGLSMATIQQARVTRAQINNLFWLNCGMTLVMAAVVLLLAPVVARFYGKPCLAPVTAVLSVSFLISGVTIQHQALLQRHMMFGPVAVVRIASYLVYVLASAILAWYGMRYWSLVCGSLLQTTCSSLLCYYFCPWRPGRYEPATRVRAMLSFGGYLTGFDFLNYCARNLDNLLLGRFWGPDALGLYSRAYSLLTLPIQQLTRPLASVAIPALSRLQEQPDRYKAYYLKVVALLGCISMPAVMYLVVMAREVVELLLGGRWREAASIYMLLGISAIGQPIASTTGWLFVSQGRTKEMFRWGVIGSTLTVCAIVLGLPWGPKGVALAYSVFNCAAAPLLFYYACRKGPVGALDIVRAIVAPLWASGCTCGALLGVRELFKGSSAGITMAVGAGVTLAVVPLALAVSVKGRCQLKECCRLVGVLVELVRARLGPGGVGGLNVDRDGPNSARPNNSCSVTTPG